ncbi:hypothetical protein C2S52_003663 [Perilla frutescens var. hirtella]|nr:hypothetical protein C2S52_003663 [Perilla frutescens var. hirtella]
MLGEGLWVFRDTTVEEKLPTVIYGYVGEYGETRWCSMRKSYLGTTQLALLQPRPLAGIF